MKRAAKVLGYVALASVAVALFASILALIAAQFVAEANSAAINIGDYEIGVHGLFDQPFLTIVIAWLATGAAFLIAAYAIALATIVAIAAVGFAVVITVGSVVGVIAVLASPLILVGIIFWIAVRSSRAAPAPMSAHSSPAMPPATT